MTPIASAATAQYKPLFGVARIPFWRMWLSTIVCIVGFSIGWCGGLYAMYAGSSLVIWIAIFVVSWLQAGIILPTYYRQIKTLRNHISANIQQKYGATLDGNSAFPTSSAGLSGPYNYTLVFPDGARSEYTLRFDPNTSEPFVITAPTPDQLEQNAKK